MVSVCLPSDALLQHLPSYLGFSYLGRGVSLHGCSSKAQPLLLTLDEGYLFTAAPPDPASGSFPMSQLFTSGGQSIGVSTSTSDLPMNTQDWTPLGWTGWISLQSKWLSRVFSNTTGQKDQFFLWCLAFFILQLSHPYVTTGKPIALTRRNFVGKVISLLLNMLSRLVITFLPRSKCLLISLLQSPLQWFWSSPK